MNRKIMILMVAVVATVLPAVAVADVMISGSASLTSNQVADQFLVGPGPNYGPVQNMHLFNWTAIPNSESEDVGTMTVNYTSNLTVNEVNVLQVSSFKIDQSSADNWFNITVGDMDLSSGAVFVMYVSTSPLVFNGFSGQSSSSTATMIDHSLVGLSSNSETFSFHDVTSSTTLYIGFVIGPLEPTMDHAATGSAPTPSTTMYFQLTSVSS